MKLTNIIAILFCMAAVRVAAQPSYQAALSPAPADGYYFIDLPPQVLGGARSDLADVRIKNSAGREVAWLMRADAEQDSGSEFVSFPTEVSATGRRTEVLIAADKKSLSSFVLRIKNADVEKEAVLLGSNDRKKWFAVKDRFRLNNISDASRAEAFLTLSFPLSDYAWYKLSVNDSLSAPLNILGAGQVNDRSFYIRHLMEIPLRECTFRTEGKKTDIRLSFPFRYQIDRIVFYISSPRYYRRALQVVEPSAYSADVLSDRNPQPQSVSLDIRTRVLRMQVANGDDQPLEIDSIKAYTRKLGLVAELKKGEEYRLTYGDTQASFPQYDLSFVCRLPDSLGRLTVEDIRPLPVATAASPSVESSPRGSFFKTYGIWIIIGVVILQILYMVRKMMK